MSSAGRIAAAALLVVCGCESSTPATSTTPTSPRTVDAAALWALAPADTRSGVVVASGTGGALHEGFATLVRSARASDLQLEWLEEAVAKSREDGFDLMNPSQVPGYDVDGPLAVFFVGDDWEMYEIWPVTDREAYVANAKGFSDGDIDVYDRDGRTVCAFHGRHYRCAPTPQQLEGWTQTGPPFPARSWPAELRGDLELFAELPSFPALELLVSSSPAILRAGVRVDRGAISAELELAGRLEPALATGPTPLAEAALARPAAGVLVVAGRPLLAALSALPPDILDLETDGISARDALAAMTGEVAVTMPPGSVGGTLAAGVRDAAPLRPLLDLCTGGDSPLVTLTREGDACRARVKLPSIDPIELRLALGERAATLTLGDPASEPATSSAAGPPPAIRRHRWIAALWFRGLARDLGRGSPLATFGLSDEHLRLAHWIAGHLSEVGLGVRVTKRGLRGHVQVATTWRNPPQLVARLEPLVTRAAAGDRKAVAQIEALAAKHPRSKLAGDLELGRDGALVAPVAAALANLLARSFRRFTLEASGSVIVEELDELRADMCMCRDRVCAEAVNAKFEAWLERNESAEGSREMQERAKEIAEKYTRCMMEAYARPASP